MRASFAVSLAVLFGALLCLQPLPVRSSAAAPAQLLMGYSATTLTPISTGVPVYTYGDSIWVMSGSQTTYVVQLFNPEGAPVAGGTAGPGGPVVLHEFLPLDVAGVWTMKLSILGSSTEVQGVSFLLSQVTAVNFSMTGGSISSSGVFSMHFGVSSAPAVYGLSACAFGSSLPETVSVGIPLSFGSGDVLLTMNGNSISVKPQPLVAKVTNPFDIWVELYQNYSYTEAGVSIMLSRNVQVGSSSAVSVSAETTSTNATFAAETAVRPGLFSLRVFFDGSAGFYADQVPVLITEGGGNWTSLQECGATSQPATGVFDVSSQLGDDPSLWPSTVYLMYQEGGVEAYSTAPVSFEPSAVQLTASPWGASFNDSELSFRPGPAVLTSALFQGTFYLASSTYPADIGVSLLDGGQVQQVTVPGPYSLLTVPLDSGKLVVSTIVGAQGTGTSGVNVTVSVSGNVIARGVTNSTGMSVFYLPLGSYNVTGEYQNSTKSAVALLPNAGEVSQISLTFAGPTGPYGVILLATAVVGLVATILVWTAVYRGRRTHD